MTEGNRDRILRILAALKSKFAEGSGCTEEEANSAMEHYNNLMREHNLEEDDVSIKQEGVGESYFRYKEGKQRHEVYWCLTAIGRLSNTRPILIGGSDKVSFVGTQADRDYAEFLFRLCWNAIDTAWNAYKFGSWSFQELKQNGVHGRKVRSSFRNAMASRLAERINKLAAENIQVESSNGTALVLLKTHLVDSYISNQFGRLSSNNQKQRLSSKDAATHGAIAGDNVKLRQEMGSRNKQLNYGE